MRAVFSSRYVPSASFTDTARSSISTVPRARSVRQRLMADLPSGETPLLSITWEVMTAISDHASSVSSTICIWSTPPSARLSPLELRLPLLEKGADALRPVLCGLEDDRQVGLVAEGLLQGHVEPAADRLLGV